MTKIQRKQLEEERRNQLNRIEEPGKLKTQTIKELIAPSANSKWHLPNDIKL